MKCQLCAPTRMCQHMEMNWGMKSDIDSDIEIITIYLHLHASENCFCSKSILLESEIKYIGNFSRKT